MSMPGFLCETKENTDSWSQGFSSGNFAAMKSTFESIVMAI